MSMVSAVHRHLDVFDDRNAFLQMMLGMVSACDRLLDVLVAAGPATQPSEPRNDDQFLDAALGIVSIACAVLRHAKTSVGAPTHERPTDDTAGSAPTSVLPGDLRSLLV
jgi:hypothetical protein